MKRNLCVLMILLLFIGNILYLINFKPIVKAIKIDELSNKEYIIVEVVYTTASAWAIIGDQNGYYDTPVDVKLVGNKPNIIYDIQVGENNFVCYGEYLDDIINSAGYINKVYNVDEWSIVYPVHHNGVWDFILSSKYLYEFETLMGTHE